MVLEGGNVHHAHSQRGTEVVIAVRTNHCRKAGQAEAQSLQILREVVFAENATDVRAQRAAGDMILPAGLAQGMRKADGTQITGEGAIHGILQGEFPGKRRTALHGAGKSPLGLHGAIQGVDAGRGTGHGLLDRTYTSRCISAGYG